MGKDTSICCKAEEDNTSENQAHKVKGSKSQVIDNIISDEEFCKDADEIKDGKMENCKIKDGKSEDKVSIIKAPNSKFSGIEVGKDNADIKRISADERMKHEAIINEIVDKTDETIASEMFQDEPMKKE